MGRCYIVICGLSGSTIFFHLPHKRHDFWRKKTLHIKSMFWFSLQLSSQTYLILRRTERDIINVHRSSCNVPLVLVNVNVTCTFIYRFSKKKKSQISNSMKIRPVGSEMIHADRQMDGRTGMTKLTVSFRNSEHETKIERSTTIQMRPYKRVLHLGSQ